MILVAVASALLLAGAVLAVVLRDNRHRAGVSVISQALATALVLADVLPVLLHGGEVRDVYAWSYPVEAITVHLDPLSAFFLCWSLPMTLLGTIYAVDYLRPSFATRHAGVHFALLNLIALSFVMVYTLQGALAFLLGWEIAAIAAWLLVIWDYRSQKIRFAGFNYLVSTHIGLFFLAAAFMVMHSQTRSMAFSSFGAFLQTPSPLRNTTFVLLMTAFGLKSAFYPFHTWLPRAHAAAPAHVSALMSGVIHKAGLFGLLRFTLLMGRPEPWMGWYLISFSALSALMGVLYSTAQRDVKRLLGYSSTENVGIAGIGFGVGYLGLCWHQPALVALGFAGGILHVLNHALFKCLLFYAAGAVNRATHTVNLERLGGLARRMPFTAGLFLLGALAISALPPWNGFVSELLIYAGLLDQSASVGMAQVVLVFVAALLAFVGGVAALATVRAFGLGFLGRPRDPTVTCAGEARPLMLATMAVHGVGIALLGLVPTLGLRLVREPARLFAGLLGAGADLSAPARVLSPLAATWGLLLAVLLGLWGLRRALARRAAATQHVTWGCGYTAPTPRMQYTANGFSAPFAALFAAVLPRLRREKLPEGPFPAQSGRVETHGPDAVEHRMFEVLGNSHDLIRRFAGRISEEPRFAFGVGLLVLGILVGVLFAGGGGGR